MVVWIDWARVITALVGPEGVNGRGAPLRAHHLLSRISI